MNQVLISIVKKCHTIHEICQIQIYVGLIWSLIRQPVESSGTLLLLAALISDTQKDQINNASERQKKKMTLRRQMTVIHWYFKSNPTQRYYRKRIIKIFEESGKFNTTKNILKEGCFSHLEIRKICRQIRYEKIGPRIL